MKMILLSGESHKKKKNLDRFRRKFHYLIEDSLLNYLVSLFKYDVKLHNLRFFLAFCKYFIVITAIFDDCKRLNMVEKNLM